MAQTWYKKAIDAKHPNKLAKLYYADALRNQEKYAEALVAYNDYAKSGSQ